MIASNQQKEIAMKEVNVGVVGYSGRKFDTEIAEALLIQAMKIVKAEHGENLVIVSGLTDLGIPALAYRYAAQEGLRTVGVACSKAEDDECFDVDESIIVGSDWGDESETFLKLLDVLVRIGGGKQSIAETDRAKEMDITVYEYDLSFIDE